MARGNVKAHSEWFRKGDWEGCPVEAQKVIDFLFVRLWTDLKETLPCHARIGFQIIE